MDPKHHRYFVARRGEVLRNIAEDYGGVTVSFPRSGVNSDKVVIKGPKDCVEAAKKKILEIVEDLVRKYFSRLFRTILKISNFSTLPRFIHTSDFTLHVNILIKIKPFFFKNKIFIKQLNFLNSVL